MPMHENLAVGTAIWILEDLPPDTPATITLFAKSDLGPGYYDCGSFAPSASVCIGVLTDLAADPHGDGSGPSAIQLDQWVVDINHADPKKENDA